MQGRMQTLNAELIKLLDDRGLALIMCDAKDDGKKALQILKEHYMSQGKPKVIALYTELTTLEKGREESTTDYVIRAEAAAAALKNSSETIGDSLLIAMILKGLPSSFNTIQYNKIIQYNKNLYTGYPIRLKSVLLGALFTNLQP